MAAKKMAAGGDVEFSPDQDMSDVSPADVREAKMRSKATKAAAEDAADESDVNRYRSEKRYTGYEDFTPSGRSALKTYNKADADSGYKPRVEVSGGIPYNPVAAKKAQKAQREVMNEGVRETKRTVPSYKLASGGTVRGGGLELRGKTKGRFV